MNHSLLNFLKTPIAIFFLLIVTNIHQAYAASTEENSILPLADNLQTLGQKAIQNNIPIAILFSAKGLKSTERLKEEAILPALYSGSLEGYVLMREIQVNTDSKTIDFYGEAVSNQEFKQLYNLTSLPVVLFFNGDGEEITAPLLSGAYDYYFFYLKNSINEALKALENPKQIP